MLAFLFFDAIVVNFLLVLQEELVQLGDTISAFSQTTRAIVTSFFFTGSFFVMGVYMFLLFIQNKKNDYLLYALYLLVFTFYFFLRIDDVLRFDLFGNSYVLHQHLLTPLLLIITSIYVRFINLFAEIKRFDGAFSKRLNIFCILLLVSALGIITFTFITKDFDAIRRNRSYFTLPMHAYTLLALIRAFVIIKSKIRHYILWSNIFLFTFSIIGVYSASSLPGRETISSNSLFGFYAFNASQLGIFLEMICFSLGLGYKFSLIEKEKDEVNEKYIRELQKNEEVTRQLNEELTDLVKKRTHEIQNKNKLLEEEQKLKSAFFTNISHEFRTPLSLILGPLEELLKRPTDIPRKKELLVMMERNSKKLLRLVDQLLDISKIDMGKLNLQEGPVEVKSFLSQLIEPFKFAADKKNIKFDLNQDYSNQEVIIDKEVLEKILVNLFSNAIKYTPEGGTIKSMVKVTDTEFQFSILNSGKGLTQDQITKIFDRFYRTNDNGVPGTGIGLSLVKDLVDLSKGYIEVESKESQWTQFRLGIPCSVVFSKKSVIPETHKGTDKTKLVNEFNNKSIVSDEKDSFASNRPTVLVIDDNQELLNYLKQLLESKYKVVLAMNGKEGLKKISETNPDLILSDVMMPEMDGLELSKRLKNNIHTSHIPLILLTAKASKEDTIKGLELGVDDYLVKPFNSDHLLTKIEALLQNRVRLRHFYKHQNRIKPENIDLNSTEVKFLSKLDKVAKSRIQEPNFNVSDLCDILKMSRMQVHRKLRATLGVSASEFINIERLNLAKKLLAESEISISEVAYSCGFNSPNYFSKRFKMQFGETAGTYRKSIQSKY